MKTSVIFAAFSIVALSVMLFWARFTDFDHSTSVTVSEDENTYTFSARYDRRETGRVERYINQNISPDQMGSSENDYVDASTTLNDNTRFHIKESPGKLEIQIDKKANSPASCYRIRKLCDGVKDLLGGR
jgi:hypothetical protein